MKDNRLGTCGGGGVKVNVDNFRSGDHRVQTDGDLPLFGSRSHQGHCRHPCGAAHMSISLKARKKQNGEAEGEIRASLLFFLHVLTLK